MDTVSENKTEQYELLQLVTFRIGNEEFGVNIFKVREINKIMKITQIPNSPPFVEGIINLRGKITPVIDLRSRLGLEKSENTEKTSIVVVEFTNTIIGMIVDEVNEVLRISPEITEAPPALVSGIDSDYITSVAKLEDRLLILLDIDKILNEKEVEEISDVA